MLFAMYEVWFEGLLLRAWANLCRLAMNKNQVVLTNLIG